jgi:hypothetical protein
MVDNETLNDIALENNQPESAEANENDASNTVTAQDQHPSSKEENMRALREKAERLQKQNEEYARALQEAQFREQYFAQMQQPKTQPELPDIDPNDDDLVEGKHYKKLAKKLQEVEQNTYKSLVESRIRTQFPDYDSVVTQESLKALREAEPDIAASLAANPDYLSKAMGAYRAIQRLGLQPSNNFETEKAIAQKNATKPRTVTSISPQQGESPLSRANAFANGLTPELKQELLKEMQDSRKGY